MSNIDFIKNLIISMIFMFTFLLVGLVTSFTLIENGVFLPLTFGSLCALIGLICNLAFSYARTLDKPESEYLNTRAARILTSLARMSICALATIPSMAADSLSKDANDISQFLYIIIAVSSGIASSLFIMLTIFIVIDLIYLAEFTPIDKDKVEDMVDFESGYEKFLRKYFTIILSASNRLKK